MPKTPLPCIGTVRHFSWKDAHELPTPVSSTVIPSTGIIVAALQRLEVYVVRTPFTNTL